MSTLQEFLIKSAGMEKEARNAIARRILAMANPEAVVKQYGKQRSARYLKDVQLAANNFKMADKKSRSLLSRFRTAAQDLGARSELDILRKIYTPTLESSYGIVPRDTLVKRIKEVMPDYDTSKLTHQNYVIGDRNRLANKDAILASTSLPYTDPMHLPAQTAALNDIQHTRNSASVEKLKAGINEKSPRSVEKALALIKGQNILEPGTRANRLFNKIYVRPELRKKLGLPHKLNLLQYNLAQNAFYDPRYNIIAVSPKFGKNYGAVRAHEMGHFTSYNAPADEHAAHAYKTLRRMKAVADKNKFNLPLQDDQLMQEVLAESYIPKILGKTVKAPRTSYLTNAVMDIGMLPTVLKNRKNFFQMSRNKYAINNMKGTEADKELFRQLALNYGHNLL
jgi:hypothetical protein